MKTSGLTFTQFQGHSRHVWPWTNLFYFGLLQTHKQDEFVNLNYEQMKAEHCDLCLSLYTVSRQWWRWPTTCLKPLTRAPPASWSYSTYPQPLTRSTMLYFSDAFSTPLASEVQPWPGLDHIWSSGTRPSSLARTHPLHSCFSMACPKARSSGRSCILCTQCLLGVH